MIFLHKRYRACGTLIARTVIEPELLDEFLKWEAKRNPTIEYAVQTWEGKNQLFIHAAKLEFRLEWKRAQRGFKLENRRYYF